jgi:hypothetical protein
MYYAPDKGAGAPPESLASPDEEVEVPQFALQLGH